MDEKEFETYKESILVNIQEKDTNIYQEFSRYVTEVELGRGLFDLKEQKIQLISEITLEDIKFVFKDMF